MGKVVTLGEIMLRLSTEEGCRIPQSSHFEAHYGGGEANVAISLANYGHEAVFASKVPENALGHSVKKHLQSYGVGTEHLLMGGPRLGTYYMETGVGIRSASVIYDRANSSFAVMDQVEWNLPNLFRDTDIFHVSGITPALSEKWQEMTIELVKAAKQANCLVSFDVNYRGKLWSQKEAGEVIKKILPYVDICSAGELDARYLLGIKEAPGEENNPLEYYYRKIQEKYPTIQVMYSTKREVLSASANQLKGTLWMEKKYTESQTHKIEPIVDRVGGGDAFSGGVLHGLLSKMTPQEIIDFATAASALKHTIHGDCNQFSQKEVADFLANGSGKIIR